MLNPLALYRYDPWKVLRTYEPITVNQAVDATKFQGKEPVREGLVPQPYDSGESHTDQGISRQGNRRVRAGRNGPRNTDGPPFERRRRAFSPTACRCLPCRLIRASSASSKDQFPR